MAMYTMMKVNEITDKMKFLGGYKISRIVNDIEMIGLEIGIYRTQSGKTRGIVLFDNVNNVKYAYKHCDSNGNAIEKLLYGQIKKSDTSLVLKQWMADNKYVGTIVEIDANKYRLEHVERSS